MIPERGKIWLYTGWDLQKKNSHAAFASGLKSYISYSKSKNDQGQDDRAAHGAVKAE
jgi:hypothetical protein